ncbi:MAG TPA: M1 family metallopeptidase [Anaerolineales bacterium]|nr:M1 family metallopeptidase [Anaerolineales bacterium]
MTRLLASLLTLCLLAACSSIFPTPSTSTPTAPDNDLGRLDPELPMFRDGLVTSAQPVLAAMDGASTYRLDFVIADDFIHVQGKENVRYTNRENVTLSAVGFRLFPNILGGKMTVSNLKIEGMAVTPKYSLANSLMTVPLPSPLEVGESVYIGMDFELEVPTDVELNYGVLAYYEGILTLAHSYPMIAVYDDEGWNAEIPPQAGDVTFADASFFLVTVTAPQGLTIVASGLESAPETAGSQQVQTVAIGPARDFFLAASRDYEVVTQKVGEVTVNSYAPKSLKEESQSALTSAARALETFSEKYAPYPYTEFDIVITPTLALGIEYPGATAIAERILRGEYGDQTAVYLESTMVHEVAHQWFYNLVGSYQLDEPWLDESLAQYVTWQYYETNFGAGAADGFEASLQSRWERVQNAPIPIGQPVAAYVGREYGAIVYGRGAFFFEALKNEMGAEAFDAFLKDYTTTFSWENASTEGLKSLAEEHCGCDLTPLFEEWIYP